MVKSSTGNNGSGGGKLKALEEAIGQIEKRFGKGAILRMGESGGCMAVEVIPSGSLSLDLALGVGGIPRGRAPFRQARFDVMFGQGISREGEILDLGEGLGILSRSGSWYQWDGQALGQGREVARKFLRERQDVAQQIEGLIRSKAAAPTFRMEETAGYGAQKPDDQLGAGGNHQDDAEAEATTAGLFDAEDWQGGPELKVKGVC